MFKVLLIASVLALAMAYEAKAPSEEDTNAYNFKRQQAVNALAPSGHSEEDTNNENAKRQHGVNKKALYYGAGVGTAHYYGVPGTDKKGYHNAHYAAPAYGAYGYGHHGAYNGARHGAYNNAHHDTYNNNHNNFGSYNGAYNGGHYGAHNSAYNIKQYSAYPAYGFGQNAGYAARNH